MRSIFAQGKVFFIVEMVRERRPPTVGGFQYLSRLHHRREGEYGMSLEAIEKVTQIEQQSQERKAAAEAEARKIVADAEREGLALLQQARAAAAENGRKLLREAEERADEKAAEISRAAEAESAALQNAAGKHLDEAAEFIVGRVVNH